MAVNVIKPGGRAPIKGQPVGVFAPKIGKKKCPPFCIKSGKLVFTPSAATNPKAIIGAFFKPPKSPFAPKAGIAPVPQSTLKVPGAQPGQSKFSLPLLLALAAAAFLFLKG